MTRRAVLAAAATPIAFLRAAPEHKPNIVFIVADDMGYADVSCYGRREYTTPNIDRLAAEGIKLHQAYANSAVCTASRVALITGRYQYRLAVGLEEPLPDASRPEIGLPPAHPTLPSLLKKAGYGTTLIGKWHLGTLPHFGPLQSGYDHFWGFRRGALDYFTHKFNGANTDTDDLWDGDVKVQQHGYLTDLIGDRAVASINAYAGAQAPFLLSLHFNAPHWPWEGPNDEALSKTLTGLGAFDAGTLATYGAMVMRMDFQIGRVLKALDRNRMAQNTIVIFTSDNGGERFSDTWPFTGKKTELLEGGLRIPALVRWPARIVKKSTTEQVAMGMDWAPTLLAAAGGAPDPRYPFDGINLLPALTEKAPPVPRKLFWRYRLNAQRAVRDGDMKFLKINDNTFLFDVAADPLERANLRAKRPDVFARLAHEWDEWAATMLPEDPAAYTYGFHPGQLADHYNPQPAPPPANTVK